MARGLVVSECLKIDGALPQKAIEQLQQTGQGTGASKGFSSRYGAKNSVREARKKFLRATPKFLSATLIFGLLGYFGYFFAIFCTAKVLGVPATVDEKVWC